METWPVSARTKPYLTELLQSHDICPLPAFDEDNELIPPTKYNTKLCGATAEVHFTYLHFFIKKNKRHIYLPVLRKLSILRRPLAFPSSPHKRFRVSAS